MEGIVIEREREREDEGDGRRCKRKKSCRVVGCVSADFMFVDFFFNDTATTEIYTLSLHDALPISPGKFFDQFKI